MRVVPYEDAVKSPSSHAFVPGRGYIYAGQPRMPTRLVGVASVCEPPAPAADRSWHDLNTPGNDAGTVRMQWVEKGREWIHQHPGKGKRVGFTSAYLAAIGWTYAKAAPGPH